MMTSDNDWFNSSLYLALAILVRFAGVVSALGAGYIIQDIVKDANRRKPTRNRIMLFMSTCDFLATFSSAALGPVMVPQQLMDMDMGMYSIPGAAGNQWTCDVQGFVVFAAAVASGLYSVSLALCYLLIVRYEYSDDALRTLEPYFLYIPPLISLILAIPGLPFGIYNFNGTFTCFVEPSPYGCTSHYTSEMECVRGGLGLYWFYIGCVFIFISAIIIIVCMVKMYRAALDQERSVEQYRFSAALRQSQHRRELSHTMRRQGLWYSGAFLFTFSPQFLSFLKTQWVGLLLVSLPTTLMGLTNAVIYTRPRFLKFRREFPHVCLGWSIWYTLIRTHPSSSSPPRGYRGSGSGRGSAGHERMNQSATTARGTPSFTSASMNVNADKSEKDPTKEQQQESVDTFEFQSKKSKDSSTLVKQIDDEEDDDDDDDDDIDISQSPQEDWNP